MTYKDLFDRIESEFFTPDQLDDIDAASKTITDIGYSISTDIGIMPSIENVDSFSEYKAVPNFRSMIMVMASYNESDLSKHTCYKFSIRGGKYDERTFSTFERELRSVCGDRITFVSFIDESMSLILYYLVNNDDTLYDYAPYIDEISGKKTKLKFKRNENLFESINLEEYDTLKDEISDWVYDLQDLGFKVEIKPDRELCGCSVYVAGQTNNPGKAKCVECDGNGRVECVHDWVDCKKCKGGIIFPKADVKSPGYLRWFKWFIGDMDMNLNGVDPDIWKKIKPTHNWVKLTYEATHGDTCSDCKGVGKKCNNGCQLDMSRHPRKGQDRTGYLTCTTCGGSKYVKCPVCGGEKTLPIINNVKISFEDVIGSGSFDPIRINNKLESIKTYNDLFDKICKRINSLGYHSSVDYRIHLLDQSNSGIRYDITINTEKKINGKSNEGSDTDNNTTG